jgi:hypothetical protein
MVASSHEILRVLRVYRDRCARVAMRMVIAKEKNACKVVHALFQLLAKIY